MFIIVSIYDDETAESVCIVLTILGLEYTDTEPNGLSCLSGNKVFSNGKLDYKFLDNSFEFKCTLNCETSTARYYKWNVQKLPTKINPKKCKVKVILTTNVVFLKLKFELFLYIKKLEN